MGLYIYSAVGFQFNQQALTTFHLARTNNKKVNLNSEQNVRKKALDTQKYILAHKSRVYRVLYYDIVFIAFLRCSYFKNFEIIYFIKLLFSSFPNLGKEIVQVVMKFNFNLYMI